MLAPDPHPDAPAPETPGRSLPLSDRDRELLKALRDPSALAAIDPAEYAAWIERPEIQKAIAAQDDLADRRQRLQAEAHHAECLADNRLSRERLRAVLEATMDLTDEAQRTDHRRAATALGRLASTCRPPSPSGGGSRAREARPVGALSSRASPTRSTAQPRPASRETPPSNAPSASVPEQSSSTVPGLDTTIAAFLAAVGAPGGLHHASDLVANHRIPEIGAHNLIPWLESQTAPLRGAQLRPGRTIHHDRYDAAEQYIHAVHPDGALSTWIIECVLEREPDRTPARWAIARVNPDTS